MSGNLIYKYEVFDSTGTMLKSFNTYEQAQTYKISRSRMDWTIRQFWIKQ